MPAIPLQKYCDAEFPMTPKSTRNFWAVTGFYHSKGPLAGKVKLIGKRWYVVIASDDKVVEEILSSAKNLIRNNQHGL